MNKQTLITGASGQLGPYLIEEALRQETSLIAWYNKHPIHTPHILQSKIDLESTDSIQQLLQQQQPQVIIHAAGLTQIAACFKNPAKAEALNATTTQIFADYAITHNARLIYLSTDMVFDGDTLSPYSESDKPNPQTVYGQSKYEGEKRAYLTPNSCVIRLPLLYGPSLNHKTTFQDQLIEDLSQGKKRKMFSDEYRTPLLFADAAKQILALASSHTQGLFHLAGPNVLSRYQHAKLIAQENHLGSEHIEPGLSVEFNSPEPRPLNTSLDNQKFLSQFPEFRA